MYVVAGSHALFKCASASAQAAGNTVPYGPSCWDLGAVRLVAALQRKLLSLGRQWSKKAVLDCSLSFQDTHMF